MAKMQEGRPLRRFTRYVQGVLHRSPSIAEPLPAAAHAFLLHCKPVRGHSSSVYSTLARLSVTFSRRCNLQKKTQLEHILLRPDTYIGSTEKQQQTMWVHNGEKLELRAISYVPGLYKVRCSWYPPPATDRHLIVQHNAYS